MSLTDFNTAYSYKTPYSKVRKPASELTELLSNLEIVEVSHEVVGDDYGLFDAFKLSALANGEQFFITMCDTDELGFIVRVLSFESELLSECGQLCEEPIIEQLLKRVSSLISK